MVQLKVRISGLCKILHRGLFVTGCQERYWILFFFPEIRDFFFFLFFTTCENISVTKGIIVSMNTFTDGHLNTGNKSQP